MDLEQPVIRISVRNLVEFILRAGDIDNRIASTDKAESTGRFKSRWVRIIMQRFH